MSRAIAWALLTCLIGGGLTWAAWSAGEERGYYRGVQYSALAAQPTATPTREELIRDCYRMPTSDGVTFCLYRMREVGPNASGAR